jgi:hypothetical protein
MSTNKTSGLQIAVLGSAVAMYAGLLGYLHFHGLERPLLASQGEAINQQLQSDLQQRSGKTRLASAPEQRPVDPDQRIVRPRNGGIFDTTDTVDPAADTDTTRDPGATGDMETTLASSSGPAAVSPAEAPVSPATPYPPANGALIPVTSTPTWRDADALGAGQYLAAQGRQAVAVNPGYRQYGNGRGRGNGRGSGSAEGGFSFSMRFTSRLRGDSDITADGDWNGDARGRQDWRQAQYGQQYPAAQAYSFSYSAYR